MPCVSVLGYTRLCRSTFHKSTFYKFSALTTKSNPAYLLQHAGRASQGGKMRDPGNKVDKKQAQNDAMNVKLTIRWKKPLRGLFLGSIYVFNLTSDFRFVTSAVFHDQHKNMVHQKLFIP